MRRGKRVQRVQRVQRSLGMYSQPSKFPTFKSLGLFVPGGSRKNPDSPWVQPAHVIRDGRAVLINHETDGVYARTQAYRGRNAKFQNVPGSGPSVGAEKYKNKRIQKRGP